MDYTKDHKTTKDLTPLLYFISIYSNINSIYAGAGLEM